MTRTATARRTTKETDISVELVVDGTGSSQISTGVGFYDHLLTAFAHHGMFDLTIEAAGDLHIDEHHTVEDVALVLGTAFSDALGDRTGLVRYGDSRIPMDEALAAAAIDVASGRSYAVVDLELRTERIGTLGTQMLPHLLEAFARTSGFTLNVSATGRNDHHVAEAAFKALGRAVRAAVTSDPRRSGIASSKGLPETSGSS